MELKCIYIYIYVYIYICIVAIVHIYIYICIISDNLYIAYLLNMDLRQRRPSYDYELSFWPPAGIIMVMAIVVRVRDYNYNY